MTTEGISSIKVANEAFARVDSELDAIETGMDGVMEKVSRIEELTSRIRSLSLAAGSLAAGALAEKLERSGHYADEALEDLRVVGINPENEAARPFFTSFHDACNNQQQVFLLGQEMARGLNTVPGMAEIKAQGVFIHDQDQLLGEKLRAARLSAKSALRTSDALRKQGSL